MERSSAPLAFERHLFAMRCNVVADPFGCEAANARARAWSSTYPLSLFEHHHTAPMGTNHISPFFALIPVLALTSEVHGQRLAAGGFTSMAVCNDSIAWLWGSGLNGAMGNGTTENSALPVALDQLTGVRAVAGGHLHNMALTFDGSVWTWGDNYWGQLGNGGYTDSDVPVQVGTPTNMVGIAGGLEHSLALRADGTVWAWGKNSYGQLGNGSNVSIPVPVQVSSLSGVVSIAGGGGHHSLAVTNDGTLWAWGMNNHGQLGNGTTVSSNVPVQVTTLTDVVAVAQEWTNSIALKGDGTVWAWGYNAGGQLGTGDHVSSSVPVQVPGLSGITAIAGEGDHTIALRNDGTVWAWGSNTYGQLGNGTTNGSLVAVQVGQLSDVVAIAAGQYFSMAQKADGSLWAWGQNAQGQLGNGSFANSSVPVEVTSFCELNTGVGEASRANSIIALPNPTSGVVHITAVAAGAKSVVVRDALGQVVVKNSFSGNTAEVDLSTQPDGMYVITVGVSGTMTSHRVIKER